MNTEDRILVAGETFEAIARELLYENKRLLDRVKELEVALSDISKMCGEARAEADLLLNRVKELEANLHQRDTALNAAREALEEAQNYVSGKTRWIRLAPMIQAISQIDQIQSCGMKK